MTCPYCRTNFGTRRNGKCPFCHQEILSQREARDLDALDRMHERQEFDMWLVYGHCETAAEYEAAL